jgi:hypothetical protein
LSSSGRVTARVEIFSAKIRVTPAARSESAWVSSDWRTVEVDRGGIHAAVGDQLVELDEFFLVDRVVGGQDAFLGAEAEPGGEVVEGLDPVGDRGDRLPQRRVIGDSAGGIAVPVVSRGDGVGVNTWRTSDLGAADVFVLRGPSREAAFIALA